MTLQGIDYSFMKPPIPAATAIENGLSFVCRYVSPPSPPDKNLTQAEAVDFSAHGVGIVVVFERGSEAALQGTAQGIVDANTADAQVAALGLVGVNGPGPGTLGLTDCPIYFAVDFQASEVQLPTVGEYLQGAASVIGIQRVGVYGSYAVVNYALNSAYATYAWQTVSWSGAQIDSRCHIYQYQISTAGHPLTVAGFSPVDLDRTVSSDTDYGQARRAAPVVTGVSPGGGSVDGGDSVTVTGTGFLGATSVSFDSAAATNLVVTSDTQLTVTSPTANISGAVDVTVTTPAGTSDPSAADLFTYGVVKPVVTRVIPGGGSVDGGDNVMATGTGFLGATSVSFGSAAATNLVVTSDTQLTVTSPAANASGAVDVTVTTPAGTSDPSEADRFTWE